MGAIQSIFIDIGLLVFSATFLIVSAVFSARAARRTKKITDYDKDDELKTGHKWLTRSAIVGWISVALVITLIVLYLVFGLETAQFTAGLVSKGLLFLVVFVMILTGMFSAIGASHLRRSSNLKEAKSNDAYRSAILSAVLALVGAGLVGAYFLWKIFKKRKKTKGKGKDDKIDEKDDDDDEIEGLKKEEIKTKEAKLKEEREKIKEEEREERKEKEE